MIPRPFYREKLIFVVILCTVLVFLIYLYSNQEPRAEQWPSGRCIAELASLKYQLNVVTEYKDRIDKLLTETQQMHSADKARFRDIMDSCIAMKRQVTVCQNQFEDLQHQCKKVREDYDRVSNELEKLKHPDTF